MRHLFSFMHDYARAVRRYYNAHAQAHLCTMLQFKISTAAKQRTRMCTYATLNLFA
ncbi:hypothetical protein HMPREF3190_01528 [Umbribacter vaginalis]|nr:hypothetical protein HMPREF3190_01528 [Coriobacteriales bacterium DNF00809]